MSSFSAKKLATLLENDSFRVTLMIASYLIGVVVFGRLFYWMDHHEPKDATAALILGIFWPFTIPCVLVVGALFVVCKVLIFLITI